MSSPPVAPSTETRTLPIEIRRRKTEVDLTRVREMLKTTKLYAPDAKPTPSPANEKDYSSQIEKDQKIVDAYNKSKENG